MKRPRISPFATGLIVGFVLLGAFGFTVSGLAGNNGVWHLIDDVSRDAAGTIPFLPIKYADVDPNEICAENPSTGNPTAACPTASASSTIDLVNVLRPSGVSVDADDDGFIDIIDNDTVNSTKIANNSVARVDVIQSELCTYDPTTGAASAGCPKSARLSCLKVWDGDSGIITMPPQCGSGSSATNYSGACAVMVTIYNDSTLSPVAYTQIQYAQFEPNINSGDTAFWSALLVTNGGAVTVRSGTNGDGTPSWLMGPLGASEGQFALHDDNPAGEVQNDQWYIYTPNPNGYKATVWVC